jgi:ABC-2 type transport system permease protein
MVEGRKFTQIDFILPGQLAFMLLTTGVYAVVFTLITLRSTLVIKRMFATPASKWIIILGEVTAKLLMAMLQTTVIILVGHFVFEFTLVNGILTYLAMLILSVFGLVVFMGFGFVIASLAKDENAASPIANLVTLPQMFLSGAFFSISAFPEVIQPIAHVLPMTFLNEAMRKVAFEGSSLLDVGPELLGLTIWGIVVYIIAIKFFRWE